MHIMYHILTVGLALLGVPAQTATIRIDVGDGGLVFSPNSTTAAINDTIEFHFYPRNHSVAAGDYENPCRLPAYPDTGFFTGFVAVSEGESVIQTAGLTVSPPRAMETIFRYRINSTDPLFYYCTAGRHCQGGMVGVINPTHNQTLQNYLEAARLAPWAESPDDVYGGEILDSPSSAILTDTSHSCSYPNASASSAAAPSAMHGWRGPGVMWYFMCVIMVSGPVLFGFF